MNRIRLMTLALGLLATTPVVAQQRPDSAEVKERVAKLSRYLKLTPEQNEKLKPIIQMEVADLRAVKDKHKGDTTSAGKASRAAEARTVREKYEAQVNAVLTPEQQAKWKKLKEEKMKRKGEPHGSPS